MRIRILRKPAQPDIDGVNLSRFEPGFQYDVGYLVAALLLADGYAEPVILNEPGAAEPNDATVLPPNLKREIFPPYYDAPPALAIDRRRRPRRGR